MEKHQSEAQKVVVQPEKTLNIGFQANTVNINIAASKVDWIATEMLATRRRIGKIAFKQGFFLISNNQIVGGAFTGDMETMDITDVPIHEKIARKNLLNHLKSDDFFHVSKYPLATLKITRVEKGNDDHLKLSGNLSIRGITKNIKFLAQKKENYFNANFKFNRLDWNIAFQGSWADKTLIT